MLGCEEEGIAQLQEGVADFKSAGTKNLLPYLLALLAEAYGKVGRAGAGLNVLAEALTQEEKTGEHFYEAELCRLRGELTLHKSRVGIAHQEGTVAEAGTVGGAHPTADSQVEAEACFLKAIEISRQQQAKSLELRAVMSLVRLRQQQVGQDASHNTHHESRNKLAEAHRMLSEVYAWFTEGFDTKDLQEAKTLLEELA
jgi:predicted ATPase